ncbi:RUS family member 1 [Cataglyphis hispanica]|uniref:RUS family member 1 n=1 Tax=Cataglyphis hispanica TaxID=1086592 RepID=UPI0021807D09|nr:RUS family member 1 [Cataglyphis hispanica]XP_050465879.1 RUS family member 1 [Cataglyphis hispanica]XP_050465880.1 RUS family member 1 [Cataglyphis hispanica]
MRVLFRESYGNEKETIYIKSEDGVNEMRFNSTETQPICSRIVSIVKEIFLPQGYPDSVHSDYTAYQIWDTVQASASTIMNTLATHSIMIGIGVGESNATPLAAAITWILKSGAGMIGSITFAWWNGTKLDGQCKKWRLFADILNDMAAGMELLVSYFSSYSVIILCISTIMKSLVGVAGGATRVALIQHQAIKNNLADVAAKDGSQEMCVNLIASFIGVFILSLFHDGQYLIELYLFLVAVHLYANYSAVKVLCLDTLNEDRLALIIKNYMINERIPEPKKLNKEESVFLLDNPTKSICGFDIKIGVSFVSVLKCHPDMSSTQVEFWLKLFEDRKYFIIIDIEKRNISIILKKDIQSAEILEAYFYASMCGFYICMAKKIPIDLLLRSETFEPSYPLLNVYTFYKKYMDLSRNIELSIPEQSIYAINSIVSNEYKTFLESLDANGWKTESNFLTVGAWRFSMGVGE